MVLLDLGARKSWACSSILGFVAGDVLQYLLRVTNDVDVDYILFEAYNPGRGSLATT